jgi:DNA-binding transcriptional LysR family regulator
MNHINLKTIDLNLLTVFQAIYSDGQIVRAAATLGLTQPAVSHALARLRLMFDDALFVRSRSGMDPTPRAHELSDQIDRILENVQQIVAADRNFDPSTTRGVVTVGMLDYGMNIFAPDIGKFLSTEAPGVTINCQQINIGSAAEMLDRGNLDIAVAPFGALPKRFRRKVLLHEENCVVARRHHPKLKGGLTEELYASLGHVCISPALEIVDRVDEELQSAGIIRKFGMSVPHYSAALRVISKTDYIATVPRGPAELYLDTCRLDLFDVPTNLTPRVISAIRHQRHDNAPLVSLIWDRFDAFVAKP